MAEVLQAPAPADAPRTAAAVPVRVATLGAGDYCGELALLNQAPRAATVRALTSLDVLELAADDFTRLVSPTWQLKQRMERAVALRATGASIPLFQDLPPADGDLLISHLREESFAAGDVVIRQGDEGERFYVVQEGRLRVVQSDPDGTTRTVAELGPGDFFGELALLTAAPRNASVLAL